MEAKFNPLNVPVVTLPRLRNQRRRTAPPSRKQQDLQSSERLQDVPSCFRGAAGSGPLHL